MIHDVTLTMTAGTVTALVGPSGSGKSTLAALLARFHDVDTGAIRIDGRDIRTMSPDELYTRVGFVFQDIALVAGTVRDNIALARPDAAAADIERAARTAQIHDRILQLPDGYDTVIGRTRRCRAVKSSASPSPAHYWPTPRSSSSTRPRPSPIPNPNTWCNRR